jgi:hypothetical protein
MIQQDAPLRKSDSVLKEQLAIVAVVLLTAIAMGRLCANEFTSWDDFGTVHQNPWLLPPRWATVVHYWKTPEFGLYMPVTYTMWAVVAFFAVIHTDNDGVALDPWLFHSANVLCHLLAVLLVYRILRLLNFNPFPAACGAAIYGVHPVQVEAVAWVSGLKDVLSGLLALLAVQQYIRFAQAAAAGKTCRSRYTVATVAFILSLLSKPAVMALPLATAAIDHWLIGRPWKRVFLPTLIWVLIAFPLAIIAMRVQDAVNTPMPAVYLRPLIAADALSFYMGKLLWPRDLVIDYSRTAATVLAHGWCYWDWIFPAGAATVALAIHRTRPALLVAAIIFVVGLVPVLGFTPSLFAFYSTTADHYLYFSMLAVAIAAAWALSQWPNAVLRWATIVLLLVLIRLSIHQGAFWSDDASLFGHDTQANPDSYIGFLNLGGMYVRQRDDASAAAAYRRAVQLNPSDPTSWSRLASELDILGDDAAATNAVQKAIDLQIQHPTLRPNWGGDNALLGDLLIAKGRYAQALPYLETAARTITDNPILNRELAQARAHAATQPVH